MDRAAQAVMNEYQDVVLGFGESDEYRWVLAYFCLQSCRDKHSTDSFGALV